jgi:hypothetical protein
LRGSLQEDLDKNLGRTKRVVASLARRNKVEDVLAKLLSSFKPSFVSPTEE